MYSLKRGKLAILSLTIMVMIAGYINYKYDANREKDLGKTVLVNGSEVYLYQNNEVNIYEEQQSNQGFNISSIKLAREEMYSQLENTYELLLKQNNMSQEEKQEYQKKLDDIIQEKYNIRISEESTKAYGLNEVAFVINKDNLQVYISNATKITNTQLAAIQTIAKTNFNIDSKSMTVWEEKNHL